MTDTAPAAPAAPVAPAPAPAAPAAPAPAAATIDQAPATPVAPAAPAAPPAVVDPPAAPVVSLLGSVPSATAPAAPVTDADKLAAARDLIQKAEAAANPNNGVSWLLKDGVMGEGEKPAWFKQDKYKTVAAQAEAYVNLESRFGSFVGAPKDGKYTFTPAEDLKARGVSEATVNLADPTMQELTKWAKDNQLSQDGYNYLMNGLVDYRMRQEQVVRDRTTLDPQKVLAELGSDANTRIDNINKWVRANLGAEGVTLFESATTMPNAALVVKALESVISKTTQTRMPKPGEDVNQGSPQTGEGLQAIKTAHAKKDNSGKLLVDSDPSYRRQIDKMYADYFAGFPAGSQYSPDGWVSHTGR